MAAAEVEIMRCSFEPIALTASRGSGGGQLAFTIAAVRGTTAQG
jgi:hypothetical protein